MFAERMPLVTQLECDESIRSLSALLIERMFGATGLCSLGILPGTGRASYGVFHGCSLPLPNSK